MKLEHALAHLARETARARARLLVERLMRAGLPVAGAVCLWGLVAIGGAHTLLPALAQSLTAIAALAALLWLGARARSNFCPPSEGEARARLAQDGRLDAGAFETLRDQPARYDADSVALWRRARERALEQVARLGGGRLRPRLDDIDPRRLRYVAPLLLVGAFFLAGAEAPDRLARAFLPDPGPLLGDKPMVVEAWATPAEYTHAAPVSLSDRLGERVATPPSIEVTVRLTGLAGAPRLVFRGGGEVRSVRLTRAADGAWEARMAVPSAGKLSIVRFHQRGFWRIAPALDALPTAAFTAPVLNLQDQHASIRWRAGDDFGVRALLLRVHPVSRPLRLLRADPVDAEIETLVGDPRQAEASSEVELAAHPYAGLEVEARLVAIDALGQEGVSAPLRFTMPERIFVQPLARAAIEIRRHILADARPYRAAPRRRQQTAPAGDIALGNQRIELRDDRRRPALSRAPGGVRRAARLIDTLTADAQDGYFADLAVYLGLRLARSELGVAGDGAQARVAAETLWHVAQRAEYGGAAETRFALEQAQSDLSQTLQQPGARQDAGARVDAVRQAVQRYLQALAEEALRNRDRAAETTRERAEITGRDIERMLDEIERLTEQGAVEEAEAASQNLTELLQNLDVQVEQAQAETAQEEQAQEDSQDISELMQQQQALNQDTQGAQQEQQSGQGGSGGQQQGGQGGDELAQQQGDIREALAQAQAEAGETGAAPSPALSAAGEAMRHSENALRRGDFEGARNAQAAALDGLREGAGALLAPTDEASAGSVSGEGGEAPGALDLADPLGRGRNDGGDWRGGQGGGDPSRTRALFDDILRRAQDPNRPEAEREYLRRLLDRFGAE